MMGTLPPQQNALFYEFCLENHIPENHLLRRIDQFIDFDKIRIQLKDFYSHTGRPSIDPELMIRMLLVGYCYGIRSERRLCEEINYNLAYRWFCGMGLEDDVPNHSTFSKNRLGRYREADIFRFVFDAVVQRCNEEGLIKGEGFAIDASFIRADVSRQRGSSDPIDWGPSSEQSRAVKEYLNALDERPELKRSQKIVSLTDPMAQWSGAKGPAQFFYSTNTMVDIECGVIMDVEASPSTNSLEVATNRTMIDRVEKRHGILPDRLLGDTAYGAAANLGYLVEEKNIEPHVPVWDKTGRKDGTFSSSDFTWVEYADEYRCPADKPLRWNWRKFKKPRNGITKENTINYKALKTDCKSCSLKTQCCPNVSNRQIKRSIYEKSRDVARDINNSSAYRKSVHERKKVEMSYAHMKRNLRFDRLRLRGIESANDEFVLVASVQNLKKLAKYSSRPPPFCREVALKFPIKVQNPSSINLLTNI